MIRGSSGCDTSQLIVSGSLPAAFSLHSSICRCLPSALAQFDSSCSPQRMTEACRRFEASFLVGRSCVVLAGSFLGRMSNETSNLEH